LARSKRIRTLLFGLLGVGVITTALGGNSLASFTATTTNPNNVFTNATVAMTNVAGTVISGSNCTTATASGTCATLFGASNAGSLKPSTTDISNTATITYLGSVTTGDFRLYAQNYTSKTGSSSSLCTASNPASQIDLLISAGSSTPALVYPVQNTTLSSALTSGNSYTTLSVNATTAAIASGANLVLYSASLNSYQQVTTSGAVAGGATSIPVTSFTANAAYGSGTQVAPQGTLDGFATAYTSAANGLQLKGGTNGSGAAGTWATNDNSVFNIKVHLDNAAANTYQGCQSQSDLVWYASQ
jgi:hypothetical protein